MALTDFKPQFDNAYQEIFQKTLVAKEVMNTRFESVLKYGESVERVAFDISNVLVRTVVRGSASTVDTVTDSSELLTINLEKEAVFHISDGEAKQAGPLNPGEEIGKQIALAKWIIDPGVTKMRNPWDAQPPMYLQSENVIGHRLAKRHQHIGSKFGFLDTRPERSLRL